MADNFYNMGYIAYQNGFLLKDGRNAAPQFGADHRKWCRGWRAARRDGAIRKRIADRVDGYDRDDLGESPDY